jgi:hypothetical protein
MVEQDRMDLERGNVAESTAQVIEIEQTTSLEIRRSRYDSDVGIDDSDFASALTEIDDESSPPTSSTNTFSDDFISTTSGWKQILKNHSKFFAIACSAFGLVLLSGILACVLTLGNTHPDNSTSINSTPNKSNLSVLC